MANDIMLPSYGGLTRFKEEYESKFQFGPGVVIAAVILTIIMLFLLNLFYK